MSIAHGMPRLTQEHVLVADIEAAHESDAAIDDKQLLVGAKVEEGHPPGKRRVHEADDLDAAPPHVPVGLAEKITAPDTVDQNTHLDAAPVGAIESADEGASRNIRAEEISRQDCSVLRRVYRD